MPGGVLELGDCRHHKYFFDYFLYFVKLFNSSRLCDFGPGAPNQTLGRGMLLWLGFLSHCIIILLNLIAPHTCIFEMHRSRWVMMMIWFGWLRYLPATELWREKGRCDGPWQAVHHSRCLSEPEPEVSLTQQPYVFIQRTNPIQRPTGRWKWSSQR